VSERAVTEDALFEGRIRFFQPASGNGYRVNVDALLLGAFAARGDRMARRAVDLGAGAGAVGLTLLYLGIAGTVDFIERDPFVAELCQKNLAANSLERCGTVHVGDVERPLTSIAAHLAHCAGLVVANPPYVPHARDARIDTRGPLGRHQARHGELSPFVRAAAAALGRRGRACFVYPAHALLELMIEARRFGLEPKRLRFVHGRADRPARVVLLELAFGKPGGLITEPPFIETDVEGQRSAELARLLSASQRVERFEQRDASLERASGPTRA
jgi:tRNA1Val (adenine37-N6)-methyltransferase